MYCKNCGQQQVVEDVRFCSGCGAKLSVEELSTGRIIAMIMLIALTTLGILGWGPQTTSRYLQIQVLIVLISVITFLLLFSSDLKKVFSKLFRLESDHSIEKVPASLSAPGTAKQVGPERHQSALLPGQSASSNPGQRGRNTADMVRPPSITEHTTELLDRERPSESSKTSR